MKVFYFFRILLNLLVLIIDLIKVAFLLLNKRKYKVFIQLEGGFGHNISEPHYLNITEKKKWILILALEKKFHNHKIKEIFHPKIISINKSSIFWSKQKQIEKLYIFVLKKILSIDVFPVKNYIMSKKYEYKINNYHECLESREFKEFYNHRNHNLYKNYIDKIPTNNIFDKLKYSKGIVNFQLRNKVEKTKTQDKNSQFRNSEGIDYYRHSIEAIIENDWTVAFGGEEFEVPKWFKNFDDKLIYRSKTNMNRYDYGFLVGLKTDIYVGPLSGAVMFNLLNPKKKQLLINCIPFGFGLINSVISYPIINFKDKNDFKKVFEYNIVDNLNFNQNRSVRKLSSEELRDIVLDFLKNTNRDYGFSHKDLNINNGIMEDTNFRVSEKWLDMVNYKNLK